MEFLSNMVLPVAAASAINASMVFIYYSSEIFPGSSGLLECPGISFAMGGCVDQMTAVPCVSWFVTIITILSNVASNVPVVQMLAATFPSATPYDWMQVSFSAIVAGNLSMIGSAANMIVAFQAAKVGDRTFTSERHAPFGIPSTILSLYAGTFLMTLVHFSPECSVKLGECDEE